MSKTRTPKMNLDALVDALDGMDPSELSSCLNDIIDAAEKMTIIESPDNEIGLDASEDRDGFEIAAAKCIESDTLFCYYIDGRPEGHAYCLGWDGADGWKQCDARQACEVGLDGLADDGDALEYCDINELSEGELNIYVRKEDEPSARLASGADTSHEDASDWYAAYGWHCSTKGRGDVTHDAVDFDWLDDEDDNAVVVLLLESMPARIARDEDGTILHGTELQRHEAECIVAKAREIREAAEAIEGLLDEVVSAYKADDFSTVVAKLDECEKTESAHGDSPASQALRAKLIEECTEWSHEKSEMQTFAITSIDDVPFSEMTDRLNEARRAGLGIDSDLMEKLTSLKVS